VHEAVDVAQELDRLVGVALTVIGQEARGGQEPPPAK